jgi:uncharacterized membrane protein (GlpM family)
MLLSLTALKLILVPGAIGLVSLAGRRWGARMAGWLAGMPVVVGPILLLLWLEQGPGFARAAAVYSLAAIAPLIAYSTTYAWLSRRWSWPACLAAAYVTWSIAAVPIFALPIQVAGSSLLALGSLLIAPRVLPEPDVIALRAQPPALELAFRMFAGAALTITVTSLAPLVGTRMSGLLALFPLMSTVLSVFTHVDSGSEAVIAMLRGLARGLYSLAGFCLTVIVMPPSAPGSVFLAAITVALTVQGVLGACRPAIPRQPIFPLSG